MAQTKKYLMFISYAGSAFWGSQLQSPKEPGGAIKTVQYVIENALKYIFKLEGERPIRINLASRTDAGVHALRAAISVTLPMLRYDFIKPGNLVELLNAHFSRSENIRVLEACMVTNSFQFHKVDKEKTYLYRFGLLKEEFFRDYNTKIIPVIEMEHTYFLSLNKTFDLKKAQEAAHLFEGIKDFGAIIGRPSKNIKPTICNITSFKVEKSQPLFPFDPLAQRFYFYDCLCKGNRFLYHMVRRMVSLTIGVGFSILNLEDIQKLFDEPFPSSWPQKNIAEVPGYGLYLIDTKIHLENFILKEELIGKTNDKVNLESSCKELVQQQASNYLQ